MIPPEELPASSMEITRKRRGRSSSYSAIMRALRRGRNRVLQLAKEKAGELTWEEVQQALGPHISPRPEDHELIISCLGILNQIVPGKLAELEEKKRMYESLEAHGIVVLGTNLQERIRGVEEEMEREKYIPKTANACIDDAIMEKALYRVQAIKKGWPIRINLQKIIALVEGHLEIVGRGENKIGYLQSVMQQLEEKKKQGVPEEKIIETLAYPTDLVIQRKWPAEGEDEPKSETWLVEVEPGGVSDRKLEKKIQRITESLNYRVSLCKKFEKQMGRAGTDHAIVFYTGTHPTLMESLNLIERIHGEEMRNPKRYVRMLLKAAAPKGRKLNHLAKAAGALGEENSAVKGIYRWYLQKIIGKRYSEEIARKYDQRNTLEHQLLDIVNTRKKRAVIRESDLPVYWLAPTTHNLYVVDLKKLAEAVDRHESEIFDKKEYLPVLRHGKRIEMQPNTEALKLSSLVVRGIMKNLGKIRKT